MYCNGGLPNSVIRKASPKRGSFPYISTSRCTRSNQITLLTSNLFVIVPCSLQYTKMSLIVEQTLPYTSAELQLHDPKRWSRLFPLIRPSIKAVELASGHTVAVDTSLTKSKDVLLVAVGSAGNFSSKILSESHLALFTTENVGAHSISLNEIVNFLRKSGFPVENGVVIIRSSLMLGLRAVSERAIDVSVVGELKLDHVLSLLSASNAETR